MTGRFPVSVVVVSYRRPRLLALTLKALEYQRHRNFEVICVADLPPEARPASPLAIRWFRFDRPNISAARNLGIAAARGEIVAFIDDDAVPEFGWLTALEAPFADPAVGAAGGFVRGRNGVAFQWRCARLDRAGRDHPQEVPEDRPTVFGAGGPLVLKTVGTNCAFRRAALAHIGGFDAAYAFFLDEADVNLRLDAAGWAQAIVPMAEVHHGFAAGPHRTADRVPTDLFELGASLAHFLARHARAADTAPRLAEFRAEQRARLDRHLLLGRLSGREVRRLLARLEAGLAAGAARAPVPADLPPAAGAFAPAPRRGPGPVRLLTAGPPGLDRARAAAARAAAEGAEVTLIAWEPTPRPLVVGFRPEGYFLHRLGLAGRAERDAPRRLRSPAAAVAKERARIRPQREGGVKRG